ncbi:MAG: DMT family transporter [Acidobacteria bacterium]|nr:DMT family transporter [Acidobacteriota bacterium]
MSIPLDAKSGELEAANPRTSKGLTAFSAYLLMSIATLSWSGNIVATKIVMDDFPPQILIPLRMVGATILFLLISPFSLRRRFERARGDWKTFAGLAITGLVLNQGFFMTGLWYSSVTHAALTFSMVPIFVLVISRWTHMEALTAPKILGVLVAFGGVSVLTFTRAPLESSYRVGDLILLAGAVVFSIYTILAKRAAVRYDALTLNVVSYPMGSLLLAPVMAATLPGFDWGAVSTSGWLAAAYVLILGATIPYLLFYKALDYLTAARVAAFGYLQPLLAAGFGIWLLQEPITRGWVLAAVLIFGGVYLVERE